MRVKALLFARAREAYGQSEEHLELPTGGTVAECFSALEQNRAGLRALRPALLVAVNESYADWTTELCEGDEVAFIPPVSGG